MYISGSSVPLKGGNMADTTNFYCNVCKLYTGLEVLSLGRTRCENFKKHPFNLCSHCGNELPKKIYKLAYSFKEHAYCENCFDEVLRSSGINVRETAQKNLKVFSQPCPSNIVVVKNSGPAVKRISHVHFSRLMGAQAFFDTDCLECEEPLSVSLLRIALAFNTGACCRKCIKNYGESNNEFFEKCSDCGAKLSSKLSELAASFNFKARCNFCSMKI